MSLEQVKLWRFRFSNSVCVDKKVLFPFSMTALMVIFLVISWTRKIYSKFLLYCIRLIRYWTIICLFSLFCMPWVRKCILLMMFLSPLLFYLLKIGSFYYLFPFITLQTLFSVSDIGLCSKTLQKSVLLCRTSVVYWLAVWLTWLISSTCLCVLILDWSSDSYSLSLSLSLSLFSDFFFNKESSFSV